MLLYRGRIDGKRVSEYQGKQRAYLQFVMADEKGAIKFLEVKVPDTMNHNLFEIGKSVEFPVTYSLVQGELFFKVDEKADNSNIKVANGK